MSRGDVEEAPSLFFEGYLCFVLYLLINEYIATLNCSIIFHINIFQIKIDLSTYSRYFQTQRGTNNRTTQLNNNTLCTVVNPLQ